jgi:poly(A) polymerase Pap1
MKKQIIEDKKMEDDLDVLDGLKTTCDETEEEECIQKPKKPRSEKQIIAFNLILEKRNEKRRERALVKEQELAAEMHEIEAKIMKKAISIKKKQIKRELILDEVSDDDEPIESIKEKILKSKATKSPLHPKGGFAPAPGTKAPAPVSKAPVHKITDIPRKIIYM